MSDMVYALNICNQDIEEYVNKRRICVPADGRPRLIDVEFARRLLKRGLVRMVDDFNSWLAENPQANARFLIIRDGGIGDLILLEPCLRSLKTAHPSIMLDVACDLPNIPVVQGFACVDNVVAIGRHMADAYDTIIDLRAYSETAPTRGTKHRTDVYAEKVWSADVSKRPEVSWPITRLAVGKRVKVAVQCGASHSYRSWQGTEELVKRLAGRYDVVLLDNKITFPTPAGVEDLRGRIDVAEFVSVIQSVDVFVGPDSGGLHAALAAGIPSVGIFGIINPDLRVRYYDPDNARILYREVCKMPGCGAWHMERCQIPPGTFAQCMGAVSVAEVADAVAQLAPERPKKIAMRKEPKKAAPVPAGKQGLTILAICLDEALAIPRWLELVAKRPQVSRVVVIDGGSTDGSVELLKAAGCEVYIHPYDKTYHDAQAMQRNISCTYLHHGERVLIMDFDECFSPSLRDALDFFVECPHEYVEIPRRTYDTYADAVSGANQVGDYPDYQPRYYQWDHRYKFVGGPHHRTLNTPSPHRADGLDILHFQGEYGKRIRTEKQWAAMQARAREYYGT